MIKIKPSKDNTNDKRKSLQMCYSVVFAPITFGEVYTNELF